MTVTNGKSPNGELNSNFVHPATGHQASKEPMEIGLLTDPRSPAERVASFQNYLEFKDKIYSTISEAELDEIARFLDDIDIERNRRREILVGERSGA